VGPSIDLEKLGPRQPTADPENVSQPFFRNKNTEFLQRGTIAADFDDYGYSAPSAQGLRDDHKIKEAFIALRSSAET
jgi:hypothetical protein